MRVRRWRVESCRLRICRSTAGVTPPPEAHSLACEGVAEGEKSGPVGDWGARDPKTGGV
jgi:hypothetical protein